MRRTRKNNVSEKCCEATFDGIEHWYKSKFEKLQKIQVITLSLLIDKISSRYNRCSFERVLAVLLEIDNVQPTICGDILESNTRFGTKFSELHTLTDLPIIKVWTGR